jgi:hypothetical protein
MRFARFSRRTSSLRFGSEEIREIMSAIPVSALRGLLADIVGNQSFRIKIGKKEGISNSEMATTSSSPMAY